MSLNSLRRWWQQRTGEDDTPFDGDAPAWVLSLGVHLVILVVLALLFIRSPQNQVTLILTTPEEEPPPPEPQEFHFSREESPEIGANSIAGVDAALAMAPTLDEVSNIETEIEPEADLPTVEVPLVLDISTAPNVSSDMLVRGAAGEGATGAVGAIDRITHEILDSLEQRRTLVVWLFDQSWSMKPQRDEINSRFARIYEELGVIEAAGNPAFAKYEDKPLLSSVMCFGQNISFLVEEPTDDVAAMQAAIASIENDPSGVEMVFSAVGTAAEKYKKFRTEHDRNLLVVVFSDEAGEDVNALEPCINICRRNEIPVYVVGVPAPFGIEEAMVKWVDPDPEFDQGVQWLPVHLGPESVLPEYVRLGFVGREGDDLRWLESGFGPNALTRLCFETGGLYFAVHPNRSSDRRTVSRDESAVMSAYMQHFFDPGIMRLYQPDYVSPEEYSRMLQTNRAKAALVQAAQMSQIDPMESPRLTFPKVDEGEFKSSLDEAQHAAARLGPKIDAIYQVLASGLVDRAQLSGPRWEAGFDLALGRILALKIRTDGYNAMLAKAKQGLTFQDPKNDTWVLAPADTIGSGSQMEKLAKQARELLERVRDQHAGTPWALLAERELATPLGWEWQEEFHNVQAMRAADGGGGEPNPANDMPRRLERPKPQRPGIRL